MARSSDPRRPSSRPSPSRRQAAPAPDRTCVAGIPRAAAAPALPSAHSISWRCGPVSCPHAGTAGAGLREGAGVEAVAAVGVRAGVSDGAELRDGSSRMRSGWRRTWLRWAAATYGCTARSAGIGLVHGAWTGPRRGATIDPKSAVADRPAALARPSPGRGRSVTPYPRIAADRSWPQAC